MDDFRDSMDDVERSAERDDDVLQRVRATLTPLPVVAPQSIARVLSAVHGRPASRWRMFTSWHGLAESLRLSPVSFIGGSTIVAAALVSVMLVRSSRTNHREAPLITAAHQASVPTSNPAVAGVSGSATPAAPASETAPAMMQAGAGDDPESALPVQFVLEASSAQSVAVAGDFNDWSVTAAPMQRLPGGNIWTITLPVRPGRHVYAFVIDGVRWIADPRAARATDSDFGKPGSVLLVNSR